MTRKDYEMVAKAILNAMGRQGHIHGYGGEGWSAVNDTARELAKAFESDNPQFDSDRFLKACRGES